MTDEQGRGREAASEPTPTTGRSAVEERYRKIFQHGNDAVMIVDLEADAFVDVNPAACELLGYSREELLAMDPEDIHPNDIDRVREEFVSQVVEEGTGFTDDLTCMTAEGREVPTEISGAALDRPADGSEPELMIAMLRDVSDRVEHRRALEEKVERLDRFASIVSHDLRTPLTVIKGNVDLAREADDDEPLDEIEAAADRMEEMLTELLRLTKEGELIGDRTSVALGEVARDVWDDCDLGGATLTVDSSTSLRADRERLRELLANLFENAAAHAGPSATVTVGATDGGFYVADDGPGVPADDRERVFEWGHTTSDDGTGFGLAIVAEIAEAHGWDVRVRESASGGARFEVVPA